MKLLLASPVDPGAVAALQQQHDVIDISRTAASRLRDEIVDREALVFRSGIEISREVLASAPHLRLLVRAGSGLDNIDLDYVQRRGLQLERIPEPGAMAVAELAFALMLALARQLRTADRLLREGRWAKHDISGHLLNGKTLGVYGCGNIGLQVARMGVAWGMRVIGCVREPDNERRAELNANGVQLAGADTVLREADFLSVHVPLAADTRYLIDGTALRRMKKGAFLVNLARGGIVDEHALRGALVSGHLAGAGVDVHEHEGDGHVSPLAELPNVLLTPHIGSGTVDTQRLIGERLLEIVAAASADAPRRAARGVASG
jgi:D-3-phosphoglycerate dehydrogenase / 2-oxoglutarate reductase